MKTQAVAARSKSGRGSRALPPALKGPRPAGSAHEREAADSGVRFVRGESGLRSALTPAAAAHWALPGSVSRAMPTALRTSLEAAFDADLAGLRVHDDAPAHRSAAAVGARAFTAGNAIYFAEGAWAPDRAGGRELIAHEVAHALQQAGRASHGHRWRLEPAAWGEAGVQRDADHNDEVRKAKTKLSAGLEIGAQFKSLGFMQPTTDTEECKAVVERHLQLPEDAAVKTQGEKIKAAVDGKSITEAVAAVDGLLSTIAEADKTDRIKAFFFDVYKSLDADDKALAVVGEALPEQTAFGSWSFYLAHRRGDAKWVTGFLKKHAVGGKYWPQMVAAVARIDFYGVTRGGLNLDPQMKFNTTMGDAIVDALLYQPTMPDERTVAALRALVGFDVIRLIPFAELARAVKDEKSLINRMGYKLSLIKRYVDPQYLVRVANGNSAEPEVVQIAAEAGALMAPIAERALNFWESVKALGQAVLVGSQADAAAKAQSARFQAVMRKRLPTLKPMAGVEKKLLPILAQALKLQAGTVPSPKLMEGNFAAAAKQVEGLVNQLDGAIAERDKKIKVGALPAASQDPNADTETDPSAQESEAITDDMVYGVVLFLLFALQSSMVQYKAPDASKDEGRRIQDQDAAVSQYHALSRGFFNLADMLGYQSLQAAAADVRYARQAGLATSYVGLMAPFEKVPATLKDFTRDFPTGELVGGAITGAMLVRTVYAMYYQNLLDKLTKALDAPVEGGTTREFDYAAGKKPIINAALDAVDASLQLPRKYRVPQEATILYVRDEDRGKTSTFLSRKHPILKQLIADELGADENGYIPESYYSHADGFVVWIIPGMGKFVEQLANVPGVVDLTLPDGKVLGKPSDYPKPSDWLEALNQAAGSDEATKKKLTDAVKDWLDKSLHDLDAPLRRATNNERNKARPLIEEQWEKVNKSFLKDPKAFFEAPRTALKYTLTFAGNIAPSTKDEQLLQMTALMLELAPVLVRKLGESTTFGSLVTISGTDRLDIVLPLYAHVSGAAHLAQSGAFGPAMPKLAMAFGADDLDRRTRQLTTLAGEFKATAAKAQEDVKLEGLPGENMLRVPNRGYPVVGKQSNADN